MSRTGDYGIKYIENDDSVDIVTDMNGNFEAVSYELDDLNDKMGDRALAQHKHNLSSNDFTGALPVSKGGTGNTSIDSAPTSGSTKMVTSGGVYEALNSFLHIKGPYIGTYNVDSGGYLNITAGLSLELKEDHLFLIRIFVKNSRRD